MATLRRKQLSRPDEVRLIRDGQLNFFEIGDSVVGYAVFEPGWRWSTHIKPAAGTDYCDFHHMGFSVSGRVHVQHRDGAEIEVGPQEFFEIPPYHDAWVVGDEPWVSVDWGSEVAFAREDGAVASRLVTTLLFTDIVDSTATARTLGDGRWRTVLARHNQVVRRELDRFRGREVTTTGDGFVVLFDSAEGAVRAGLAIAQAVESAGVRVRCGVHTGEVELEAGNVRGLAVHVAARVLAIAGPSEVLVSWTTRDLLAGSRLEFEERGRHELKGLPEPRPLYAVRAEG
ncbi:MAG TPA: adenylate/guanylate cyclase domain-containing protein [Candidatus Limnocylindrales bacterium]|jgi:class 3 adenylate cyclase|nr:adenylate/guanylate cyclase domain-containing protein [Candidatus Limnocylindrales bacterium]